VGFQHLSKERRSEIASKAGAMKRSKALKYAWATADALRKQYENGKPPSVIARENDINVRAVFRIVRGK